MTFLDSHRSLPMPFHPGRVMLRWLFDTPFDRRTRDIARDVAALRALSDDELAARGIARRDILRHVLTVRHG